MRLWRSYQDNKADASGVTQTDMTKDRAPTSGGRRKASLETENWTPSKPRNWVGKRSAARQIGTFVPELTQPAFKKKSPLLTRLIMDWEDFVGPRLGSQTEPRRLSAGTLTLACSGPLAMELQHLAPQIIERINTTCGLRGEHGIARLKIVQDRVAFVAPSRKRPSPRPVEVPDIQDDALREALEKLGGYIGAKARHT